jgi:hypothetical protein
VFSNSLILFTGFQSKSGSPSMSPDSAVISSLFDSEDTKSGTTARRKNVKKKSVQYNANRESVSGGSINDAHQISSHNTLIHADTTLALLDNIYCDANAPTSPTSMSLFMVDSMLEVADSNHTSHSNKDLSENNESEVPLECLQYFKFLNDASRRFASIYIFFKF